MSRNDLTVGLRKRISIRNENVKIFLAEFLGTFLLIVFGNGAVAQSVLTQGGTNDFFSVVFAWALGVTMGVMASGNVSGGHLNPAVSLAMAVWGRLKWGKLIFYVGAQYLGAFVASGVVFIVYHSALRKFETVPSLATAGIWATYPGTMTNTNGTVIENFLTGSNGIWDQVIATMLLLICVCAITDEKNMNIPKALIPLMVGFVVMNIGLSFGFNCGFPINPARDLAPRIFTLVAGWGTDTFTATTVEGIPWWWIPVVAPHIGAILGVFFYAILIEIHHADDTPENYHEPTKKQRENSVTISVKGGQY